MQLAGIRTPALVSCGAMMHADAGLIKYHPSPFKQLLHHSVDSDFKRKTDVKDIKKLDDVFL